MMLKVFLLSASCLAFGAGLLPSAGPLSAPLERREAYAPMSINLYEPAVEERTDPILSYFTFQEGLLAYSASGSPYAPLFNGDQVEFVWASSMQRVSSSWTADIVSESGAYSFSTAYASSTDLSAQGWPRGSWESLWPTLLEYKNVPYVAGYVRYSEYSSSLDSYKVSVSYFGMVRPAIVAYHGPSSQAAIFWTYSYGNPSYVKAQSAWIPSSEYQQYGFYIDTWHRRVCSSLGELAPRLIQQYASNGEYYYNQGYIDGEDHVVENEYHGYSYDQIYNMGKTAGVEAGSPTMLNLYGLFASVLTMPFTIVSTTFDSTLFEGTAFAFNVSVFLYSLLVILLLWKILSIIFRGR